MSRHRVHVPDLGSLVSAHLGAAPSSAAAGLAVQVQIEGSEAHHLRRVRRLGPRDVIELFDGRGCVAEARIEGRASGPAAGRRGAVGMSVVVEAARLVEAARPRVGVWSAVPKGPRADDMVDQLSQVGAAVLVPMEAERSIVRPGDGKVERWRQIAVESARQSGRAWVMEIGEPESLQDVVTSREKGSHRVVILADSRGGKLGTLANVLRRASVIAIVIGPEGGFTDEERARLIDDVGAVPVNLGPHTLRIETAAVVAAAGVVGAGTNSIVETQASLDSGQ